MSERTRPVVGLDIDGTLGDYHGHFIRFANGYFNIDADPEQYDARQSLYSYLGVSKTRYRKCKLAYRRGEMKRSMPMLPSPFPQAGELTHTLRRWGVDIWLCTTRPYLAHDEVDDSTRHWARRNGVLHQGILWGEHKYRELVQLVGKQRVVCILDDVPAMCDQAVKIGVPAVFAMRGHNWRQHHALGADTHAWATAGEHIETLRVLKTHLNKWRENQK